MSDWAIQMNHFIKFIIDNKSNDISFNKEKNILSVNKIETLLKTWNYVIKKTNNCNIKYCKSSNTILRSINYYDIKKEVNNNYELFIFPKSYNYENNFLTRKKKEIISYKKDKVKNIRIKKEKVIVDKKVIVDEKVIVDGNISDMPKDSLNIDNNINIYEQVNNDFYEQVNNDFYEQVNNDFYEQVNQDIYKEIDDINYQVNNDIYNSINVYDRVNYNNRVNVYDNMNIDTIDDF